MTEFKRPILLIDAENLGHVQTAQLVDEYRDIIQKCEIKVAFGEFNATKLRSWEYLRDEYGLTFTQTPHGSSMSSKNTADMTIAVTAMEYLFIHHPDLLILATSDVDFVPLVRQYRRYGVQVYIFGSERGSRLLVQEADKYITPADKELADTAKMGVQELVDTAIIRMRKRKGLSWVAVIPNEINSICPEFETRWLKMPMLAYLVRQPDKYIIEHAPGKGPTAVTVRFTDEYKRRFE